MLDGKKRVQFVKMTSVDVVYNQSDAAEKRGIIGSIYPEKLCFDGNAYRTAQMNEASRLM